MKPKSNQFAVNEKKRVMSAVMHIAGEEAIPTNGVSTNLHGEYVIEASDVYRLKSRNNSSFFLYNNIFAV